MKVELHRHERFFKGARGVRFDAPAPPRFAMRIESENLADADQLRQLFGPFQTNPPVLHLEFTNFEVVKYDEPQPCRTMEELGFQLHTKPGR